MRIATVALTTCFVLALFPSATSGQTVEHSFAPVNTGDDLDLPYTTGLHSGARSVNGPFDSDDDGLMEIIVTDYSSGGRVHVLENAGADTWELVYSIGFQDSTAITQNVRYALGDVDLDGDGDKEIAFLSGIAFSDTNPRVVDGTYRPGLFVFEHTGNDNDYGETPAFVCEFAQYDAFVAEQFAIQDVDDDGVQEILVPSGAFPVPNAEDSFYIYTVNDDFEPEGAASTFAVCVNEFTIVREGAEPTPGASFADLGGGSPYAIHPADLDGDGTLELSLHAWNNFNLFNVDVTGADSYQMPDTSEANGFYQATPPEDDHYSIFAGTVVDINGDGDDEVFYPRIQTGGVTVVNYEDEEDPLFIGPDNVILDLIPPPFTPFGIVAGDVTRDGNPDLIAAGPSYSGAAYDAGEMSSWLRVAAWIGEPEADPEDISNYDVRTFDVSVPADTAHFNRVVRDSAGVITVYHETAAPKFATKVAYLGDADGDGDVEIAVAFQDQPDSVQVIDEVWDTSDPDSLHYARTVRETNPAPLRELVRIYSAMDFNVAVEETVIITPDDYILDQNYPNPFNGETTIEFELPLDKRVSVRVYDITGRLVRTLVDDEQYFKGRHSVRWDGTTVNGAEVASGTYIYALEYGNFRKSRQMVVVK